MEIDRSVAKIHLDNLVYNYNQAKKLVGDSLVMAVVKADAYGHGSVKCARRLEASGCEYFAVACLAEAIELREHGISGNILIFGRTNPINHCYLSKYDLIQTVYSLEYAKELSACKEPLRIHINIDTGMSRFGLYLHDPRDLYQVVHDIQDIVLLKNLKLEGIYTHFANSDEVQKEFCQRQYSLFTQLIDSVVAAGINPGIKHAANTGALISHPNTYLDMVRFGIGLYGYPHDRTVEDFLPVMELCSTVMSTRLLNPGDSVSYGRTFVAKKQTRIATIAIGYADGYNRLLSNNDYLLYKNNVLPVVGRVCMDAIMVDIGNVEIAEGEKVEVFGLNKPLEDMCRALKTIPYEILCNVSKRVPRLYD